MAGKLLQIGEIAKKAMVNIQTIRYYERRNILKPAEIKESGYRLYSEDGVKTLRFIKHAQELGFSLDEIKELLKLRAPSSTRCESVRLRAQEKLADVKEKISMLQQIEQTLIKLIDDCARNKTSKKCPIIENMEIKS